MRQPGATDRRPHSERRTLYRIGGAAAFAAVGIALVQVAVEAIGVGILGTPVPRDVEGWYALARDHRILAVAELTTLQVLVIGLLVPVVLAVQAALRRASAAWVTVATVVGLVGIGVSLASNTSLSILSLADQYATATNEAQRSALVGAGQAVLAVYEGPGLHAGSGLLMVAVAMLSVIMLRSDVFSRATAGCGLVAAGLGAAYYFAVAIPTARLFLLEAGAVFLLIWLALVGARLRRSANREP